MVVLYTLSRQSGGRPRYRRCDDVKNHQDMIEFRPPNLHYE